MTIAVNNREQPVMGRTRRPRTRPRTLAGHSRWLGLFVERTPWIRRRPWLRRFFCWSVLIVPPGCLFPPVFVHNVMLPMLDAIGTTPSAR